MGLLSVACVRTYNYLPVSEARRLCPLCYLLMFTTRVYPAMRRSILARGAPYAQPFGTSMPTFTGRMLLTPHATSLCSFVCTLGLFHFVCRVNRLLHSPVRTIPAAVQPWRLRSRHAGGLEIKTGKTLTARPGPRRW